MLQTTIVTVMVLAVTAQRNYEDTTVKHHMNKNQQGIMKKVIPLDMDNNTLCSTEHHDHIAMGTQVDIRSMGKLRVDKCQVMFHQGSGPQCEAPQLCVEVKKSEITDCNVNVTFVEKSPDSKTARIRNMNCKNKMTGYLWCTLSKTMTITLMKDTMVENYSFDLSLTYGCAKPYFPPYINQTDAENFNRLLGIITGLACCCIFLVVLLIAFCCFRSEGWRHQRKY